MSQTAYAQVIRASSRERLDLFLATAHRLGAPVGNIAMIFGTPPTFEAIHESLLAIEAVINQRSTR